MKVDALIKCPQCGGQGAIVKVDFQLLREARMISGISLRQMALDLNISIPYLSHIERGKRSCPVKVKEAYEKLKPAKYVVCPES